MAPPLGRYLGQQSMSQFGHTQQHLQHHSQGLAPSALAPPSLGGHPSFGNPNSNLGIFASSVPNSSGFGAGFPGGGGGGGSVGASVGGGTGLGSHAAQMGFAHGAALQRQEASDGQSAVSTEAKNMAKGKIREVWRGNLAQEMAVLRGLVDRYPYIAMGTEFPGIVARPLGNFTSKADYHYQTLRCNVDLLKMIQLGVSLFSAEGEVPPAHPDPSASNGSTYPNNLIPCPCSWQFNFRFSLHNEMYAQESIHVLERSGVDFALHEKNGIDPLEFGSYLITSGLVLMEDVKWISFHSGYDFGYLLQILSCQPLPEDEADYRTLLDIFFPSLYDIKYIVRAINRAGSVNDSPLTSRSADLLNTICSKTNLGDIAKELNIARVGQVHHAGSDALLTGRVFFELLRTIFNGHIDNDLYLGQIWGLNGIGSPASAAAAAAFAVGHQQHSSGNGSSGGGGGAGSAANANGSNPYTNGGIAAPSTPDANHTGLVGGTPSRVTSNMGSLTPGGGGTFGAFQFGK